MSPLLLSQVCPRLVAQMPVSLPCHAILSPRTALQCGETAMVFERQLPAALAMLQPCLQKLVEASGPAYFHCDGSWCCSSGAQMIAPRCGLCVNPELCHHFIFHSRISVLCAIQMSSPLSFLFLLLRLGLAGASSESLPASFFALLGASGTLPTISCRKSSLSSA